MRVKKLGPALLVSEFYLPASRFGGVWPRIEAALPRDLVGLEAVAVRGDRMAILCYVLDRGDGLLFPLRMAKAMLPVRIAERHGGSVYAPGLWFASETERFLGADKHRAFRERKAQVDPHGLLNPGKLEPILPRWFPVVSLSRAMSVGAALAAPISRLLPSRRLPDPSNAS
jgi:FAD/FMN-containing dehydrogenase